MWTKKPLSEVTTILSGGTPKSGVADYWGNDIRWLTPKDMGRMSSKYISDSDRRISQLGLDKSSAKLILKNSVILSTRAPIGHLAINTEPMATNQGCRGLIPKDNLDTKFLYYFLLGSVSLLNELGTGAIFKELSKTALESVVIPFPPIPEQQRIVAILDQAFADIEKARANAEQNLKNAHELFDSYLQQVFSQRGEGWEKFSLGNITDVSSGGTPTKSTKEYWNGSMPWYSSGELNKLFTKPSKEMITDKGLKESNAKLFPAGSLLIGMYDTAALKMSLLDREGCFNQAIAGVKPNDKVNLVFIYHTINFLKPELLLLRRGVRQKNLNQSKIKSILIGLPSIEEQNEVVLLLQSLKDQSDKLVEIYSKNLHSLDELKKSLLQKAFSGELTKGEGRAA